MDAGLGAAGEDRVGVAAAGSARRPRRPRASRSRRPRPARSSGPRIPSEIASWPLAESTSTFGMKYGEMRSGPRSRSVSACSTIPISAADRRAEDDPDARAGRSRSGRSRRAPPWPRRARARRCGRAGAAPSASASPAGSKSLTSAATRTGSPSASKARIQSTPLSPATRRAPGLRRGVPDRRDGSQAGDGDSPHGGELMLPRCRRRQLPFPPMEAELVEELPTRRLAVRAEVGRLPRRAREPRRRSCGSGRATAGRCCATSPSSRRLGDAPAAAARRSTARSSSRARARLEFDRCRLRLHPAECRIKRLSAEIPADYVAFDLLLWKGKPVHKLPLEKRRARARAEGDEVPALARHPRSRSRPRSWLDRLEAGRARRRGRQAARAAVPARARATASSR